MTPRLSLARAGICLGLVVFTMGVWVFAVVPYKAVPAPIAAPAPSSNPGKVQLNPAIKPAVATSLTTFTGKPVTVSCMTCHTTRPANLDNGVHGQIPGEFHPALKYAHGNQSCLSCHNAANYDTLRQADGRAISFPDTKRLCAQCHGPQTRDYEHGSHGGMRGYWDLTRGDRTRNTCTDCHDPHAPAFPALLPVFPPKDHGARQQAERAATEAHAHE